jgi:hypothetical protein
MSEPESCPPTELVNHDLPTSLSPCPSTESLFSDGERTVQMSGFPDHSSMMPPDRVGIMAVAKIVSHDLSPKPHGFAGCHYGAVFANSLPKASLN